MILDGSVTKKQFSELEQEEEILHLKRFLQVVHTSKIVNLEELISDQMFESKERAFMAKIQSPNWKKIKSTDELTVYTLKEDDNQLIAVRAVTVVNGNIETAFKMICDGNTRDDSKLYQLEVLLAKKNYKELYNVAKLPFPLKSRDCTFAQWEFPFDGKRALVVNEGLDDRVPRKSDCIRATIYLGGYLLEVVDKKKCKVSAIMHGSAGGSLPVWVLNMLGGFQAEKVLLLKKLLEKKKGKKDFKSISSEF